MAAPSSLPAPVDAVRLSRAKSRRAGRVAARRILHQESNLKRVRACGRYPSSDELVGVKVSEVPGGLVAGYCGVALCGMTWVCPVCSARIAAKRQQEIADAARKWQDTGGAVTMVTLTMRHASVQRLADLWGALNGAWSNATSGRAWQAERERYGVAGWCRVVEATHGDNGWHVHVHAALFTDGASRWDPQELGSLMFSRWRDKLVSQGMRAPLEGSGGLHVRTWAGRVEVLGEYFAKAVYEPDDRANAIGMEVARGDLKDGRISGHRTPFRILRDIAKNGDAADLALWHEWEKASHGRCQLTWSKGFRARLLADAPELTDEEIVEQDEGGVKVVSLPRGSWRTIERDPALSAWVLELAEQDLSGGVLRAGLDDKGIAWEWPKWVAALRRVEHR